MGQIATRDTGTGGVQRTTADAAMAAAARLVGEPAMAKLVERALPAPMRAGAARFKAAILTQYRLVEKLARCTVDSQKLAILRAAATGLELGDEQWLIPRLDRTRGLEVVVQIGYQGWCQLMRRHPDVVDVYARSVHENEVFDVDLGANVVRHVPALRGPRGEAYGYYAVLRLRGGLQQVVYMSREDVEAHCERYVSAPGPAWKTSFDAMARKTVLLQLKQFAPRTRDLAAGEAVEREAPVVLPEFDEPTTAASTAPSEAPEVALPDMDALPGGPPPRRAPTPSGNTDPDGNPEPPEPEARG